MWIYLFSSLTRNLPRNALLLKQPQKSIRKNGPQCWDSFYFTSSAPHDNGNFLLPPSRCLKTQAQSPDLSNSYILKRKHSQKKRASCNPVTWTWSNMMPFRLIPFAIVQFLGALIASKREDDPRLWPEKFLDVHASDVVKPNEAKVAHRTSG